MEKEKTNHSLCVTAATSVFEKQVSEKRVKERTGHRSLTALRMYGCTSSAQRKAVSNILGASKWIFEEEMHGEPSAKKARVSTTGKENEDIHMIVQNCIVNVYIKESIDNVKPFQSNASSSSSSSDYDCKDDIFANIAHLIP